MLKLHYGQKNAHEHTWALTHFSALAVLKIKKGIWCTFGREKNDCLNVLKSQRASTSCVSRLTRSG